MNELMNELMNERVKHGGSACSRYYNTAPGVCALGWVKCREHISLLVILCIIVYVINKAHLSLIFSSVMVWGCFAASGHDFCTLSENSEGECPTISL